MSLFFFKDYFLSVLIILLFEIAGFGILSFLLNNQNHAGARDILIAPFCGLIATVLGTTFLYTLGLSLRQSMSLMLIGLSAIGIFFLILRYKEIQPSSLMAILIVTLITNLLCNSNALIERAPSMQMVNGDNAIGYSLNADWLCTHIIKQLPSLSVNDPVQVIPYQNLRTDQRLGAYIYVGVISQLIHRSSFFSYTLVASIALAASMLAITGVVTSNMVLFFLMIGLLVLAPFSDLANAGFLGKMLGFPALLFVLLLIIKNNSPTVKNILLYTMLTIGVVSLYHYMIVCTFFGISIVLFLIYQWFTRRNNTDNRGRETPVVFAILIAIAFACSGGFVILLGSDGGSGWQRGPFVDSSVNLNLQELVLLILNIERIININPFMGISKFFIVTFTGGTILTLIGSAIALKNRTAFLLVATPIAVMAILLGMKQYWAAYQLSFVFYPFLVLCLGALLNEYLHIKTARKILWSILCCIIFSIPYWKGMWEIKKYYLFSAPKTSRYCEEEIAKIKNIIGTKKVIIDTVGVYNSDPLLIELGREHFNLFFTLRSWDMTGWGLPYERYCAFNNSNDAFFRIIPADEKCLERWVTVYKGRHYQLIEKN